MIVKSKEGIGRYMAVKIAIANKKGGIGKTSTALCLASGLKLREKRVLLIDTDPQKSATGVYGAITENSATLADMLYDGEKAEECIQSLPLGDIIACDSLLEAADTKIPADADRFYKLSDACENLEKMYDYIILDCPPGNGVILGNVLSYADFVITPITCDKFGIQGLSEFKNVMAPYTKRINPNLKVLGVLITMYKGNQSLTKDLEEGIIPQKVKELDSVVFETKIRESVKLRESQLLGRSIFEYAPNNPVAIDYNLFVEEVLRKVRD